MEGPALITVRAERIVTRQALIQQIEREFRVVRLFDQGFDA